MSALEMHTVEVVDGSNIQNSEASCSAFLTMSRTSPVLVLAIR